MEPLVQERTNGKTGLQTIDSIRVRHRTKYREQVFRIFLMWRQNTKNAQPPVWNEQKLLQGVTPCIAHPLYYPQTFETEQILEKH